MQNIKIEITLFTLHAKKVIFQLFNTDISIINRVRRTPLHYACENDHLPIVEYLISKGANINGSGCTALHSFEFAFLFLKLEKS